MTVSIIQLNAFEMVEHHFQFCNMSLKYLPEPAAADPVIQLKKYVKHVILLT